MEWTRIAVANNVTVWQAAFWLHLRTCSYGQHLTPLDPVAHVTTSLSRRRLGSTARCLICTRWPLLSNLDHLALRLCSWLLPSPSCLDVFRRHRTPSRWTVWLHLDISRHLMVHIQQQCHVLCCWKNDRYARLGRIPSGSVLRGLRHYGHFLKQRYRHSCHQSQGWIVENHGYQQHKVEEQFVRAT